MGTFNDILSSEAISIASEAIQDEVADSGGFSSDYVSVSLELRSSETRRHLLSFIYDTDITITLPALVPHDEAITDYIRVLVSSEGASTLAASVVSIPELDDPNDAIEDPTSSPTANEVSGALSAGPTFSIAAIIPVMCALRFSASI